MSKTIRNKLIALGPEKLTDALLAMADRSDEVEATVERLVATPQETVKRFKAKLAGLQRSRRFIDWRKAGAFARELVGLLADLDEGIEDGKTGVELVARFFECDRAVFERCDDSNGTLGEIFRYDASKLFARFAAACPDKQWLTKQLVTLLAENDYGARDRLLDAAGEFLPEKNLRELAETFWRLAIEENDEYQRRSWYGGVEEMAKHLGDAPLFEKARLAAWGEPGTAACLDIAEVYLHTGDPQTALAWVKRDKMPGAFQADKRERLLQAIYSELGETEKVTEIAWKRFRASRSIAGLDELLTVIGQEQREAVIAGQANEIMAAKQFSSSDAEFLLLSGLLDQAEEYLLQSVEQFNGDHYYSLLPLAEAMEKAERHLAASMLYRALLDSILRRAHTKTYPHGVRYLKKLDALAPAIGNWQRFGRHEIYKTELKLAHGRKSSFWGKYDR
ncbi:MAG: hypothetical protein OEV91_06655 [Desulfobulbaceae bacterium]|nr:hypothetical protein [Desulfobulbaceae bacterium]